ncbi:cytochrome P450 monooxygenase [Pochonia chlamydosporia 170]|uniref:Cytochrome P450 monooxygenase n=1 Tax=Pochonia chlamydosporia 170 TaxID=1380566 RepID=A0A179F1F0_METCM|nr:cytochrome P450 monooxygenase [Pochonia chlamydosporia 170]OAQ58893.1 cytochrome P450 monooxygenase [Pochonia chlamydosporia 170]
MVKVILARRKDFVQLPIASKIMSTAGQNILTSDGESWSRQRRIIAPALNERISEVVWKESAEQASQMAALMVEEPYGESRGTIYGLRTIALNVLGRIAYGQPKPFKMSQSLRKPISEISYIDAVSICTEFLVVAALVPASLLCLGVMPNAIRTLGLAIKKLPDLTKDLLTREQQRLETGVKTPDNLVRMLISLSHDSELINGGMLPSGSLRQTLTEDELAGNMFIFTAAGFDTTANTMAYAVTLLAAYPQWQVWIQEEVDHVLEFSKAADVQYSTAFPKLARCLALMHETLRLFPPVLHVSRSIKESQSITVNSATHYIKGPCTVYVNSACLQTNPSFWGADSTIFNPSRWLSGDNEVGQAEFNTPDRGIFLAWSGGPRVCPGQKMSQVEFVTVIATLFQACTVDPVIPSGGTIEQAREGLVQLMMDSQPRLTLQMNKPEDVFLKWSRREQ